MQATRLNEAAARTACLARFHAAQALISERTGQRLQAPDLQARIDEFAMNPAPSVLATVKAHPIPAWKFHRDAFYRRSSAFIRG
jgi:hypothetical protein